MPEDTDTIYELSDVQVETLGLVTRGANQESFFLLKNEEVVEATPDLAALEPVSDVEAVVAKSIWRKLADLVRKAASAEEPVAEPAAEVPADTPETSVSETNGSETSVSVPDVVAEVAPDVFAKTTPEVVVDQPNESPTVAVLIPEPALVVKEELTPMADEITISKADYDALADRLAKTEEALSKAESEKERQAWITKAQDYGFVPVATGELAEQLHFLSKTDARRADWWMDVLKALDHMVEDSHLFVEKGTVQMPTSALDAVMKSDDPFAAIANLSKTDQDAYLRQIRRQTRG